jgi:hypothetical protein
MPGIFNVGRAGNLIAPVLLAMSLGLTPSCTETNFAGGAAKVAAQKKKKPRDSSSSGPQSLDMDFSGDKKIESVQNSKIWTATTSGNIKRFSLEGDVVKETLSWTGGAGGTGGMRTYLTEGGLIGARFPHLYFVDPAVPRVVNSVNIGSDSRTCVASYMKDGKRYMIAAWGAGEFIEIPLGDKPPYAPQWNPLPAKRSITTTNKWGYSCFIDQQQKVFYSQYYLEPGVVALNLKTLTKIDNLSTMVPNANFAPNDAEIAKYAKSSRQAGSYAMSGDSYGNLYNHLTPNLASGYTSAYEKSSDTVWFTHRADQHIGKVMVIEKKCLTTEPRCNSANYQLYDVKYQGVSIPIGPMSALRDGRIAGLVRGAPGGIYTIKLADPKNIKGGLQVVKVGDADGDPYMYSDFTGATLYINEAEQTFKPADMPKYAASKPIKMAVFKWAPTPAAASAGLVVEWKNIKLEARCYSGTTKPAYAEVGKVYDSAQGTALEVESCKAPNYEFVDVKLTQLNNDTTLLGVDTISVGFKQ